MKQRVKPSLCIKQQRTNVLDVGDLLQQQRISSVTDVTRLSMFDLSQPVGTEVIIGSIVVIFGLVGVGLLAVEYYKKKK